MSFTISQAQNHLSAQLHGGTLKRIRNIYSLFERTANTVLSKIDPVDTIWTKPLSNTVHDDIYNYALPSDYKTIIDLIPQDNRQMSDTASRQFASHFDLQKNLQNKKVSIEGSSGSKIIRINWRSRQGKVLNSTNSLTANGTWSILGTASNLVLDTIFKKSGAGSLRLDVALTGDGIQNTDMSEVDLTDEDEVADIFLWFYVKNSTDLAKITSVTSIWGNDLTTAYWTGVAQTTQADGSAFQVGWNQVKFPWSTATETGTVTPSEIDSFSFSFTITGAITELRVDNILFSIGRNFDIKYYSKYIFQNAAGTLLSIPTSDDDSVLLDNDAQNIFLLESLINAAQQSEGSDSAFDITYAKGELDSLYKKYRAEFPSQSKKAISYYGSPPRLNRW